MQREALIPSGMSIEEAMAYIAALDHADLARRLFSQGLLELNDGSPRPKRGSPEERHLIPEGVRQWNSGGISRSYASGCG